MPTPNPSQPDPASPTQAAAPVRASSNWELPGAVCASAIVLSVFTPWMGVIAIGALVWMALAMKRERRAGESRLTRAEGEVDRLSHQLVKSRRVRAALDGAGVPIIATNRSGSITVASRAATTALGGGRDLVGRRFDEVFTRVELHEMERHARQGERGRGRLELPIDSEMRTLIVSADPIPPASGGPGCVVTMRDVTELVRAGDLKADFAANASHELRTPIASIRGAAETLQGPARSDHAMSDRLIGIVASNAARLEAIVSDLLDLSKLESGDTPPEVGAVDLRALCSAQADLLEPVCARRSLRITADIDPACAVVRTDEGLLTLVLRNLLENATKFAREGTEIRVACIAAAIPTDPGSPPPPMLDAEHGASGIRLTVSDRGIGIPLAHQQRIFERFYQVDRARTGGGTARGTGLGLAIVKHAARRLGGRVGVDSVYQQGTTMIVELPRCVASGQDTARGTGAGMPGSGETGSGGTGSGGAGSDEGVPKFERPIDQSGAEPAA